MKGWIRDSEDGVVDGAEMVASIRLTPTQPPRWSERLLRPIGLAMTGEAGRWGARNDYGFGLVPLSKGLRGFSKKALLARSSSPAYFLLDHYSQRIYRKKI